MVTQRPNARWTSAGLPGEGWVMIILPLDLAPLLLMGAALLYSGAMLIAMRR